MAKFKPGDKVYHYRWRMLKQYWPAQILAVQPKRWYQIQQRYLITDGRYEFLLAKENSLIPRSS